MIREIKIYLSIVFILAFVWHSKQFLEYPVDYVLHLLNSGLFIMHPFILGFIAYVIISIPRLMFKKR